MNDPFKIFHSILEIYVSPDSIKRLKALWNEKTRVYHDESHLRQIIFDIQNSVWFSELSLAEKHTLLLSAFFHDSIYDPKKKDNEDQSIKFFKKSYIGKDAVMVQKVSGLIEATKHRKRPMEKLQRIFWDADNAGFKKGYKVLLDNEKKIGKEYSYMTPIAYKESRIKFLKSCIGLFNNNDIEKLIEYIKKH